MARQKVPKTARTAKVTKRTTASNKISNVGQLINRLQTYSPDESLATVNHDLLRAMLRTLRTILEKPRSVRNITAIRAIDGCYLDNEIRCQFRSWGEDPTTFWEPPVKAFPAYSGCPGPKERLRVFFSGALALGTELKIRRIQWRFVTIVAHRHFVRRNPTAKLKTDKVRDYLLEIGLEASDTNVSKCHDLIISGKRRTEFCQKLQAVSLEQGQRDLTGNQDPVKYGSMFLSSIPDDMYVNYSSSHNKQLTYRRWDNKDGFGGNSIDDCFAHLLSLEAGTWATDVGCDSLAGKLITFHDDLIWRDATTTGVEGTQLATSQCPPSKTSKNTASSQPTEPALGQAVSTTYSPWQHLLSAAESATSQAQQTHGRDQPGRRANGFSLVTDDSSSRLFAEDTGVGSHDALSSSDPLQPVAQPRILPPFDTTGSWRGDPGTVGGDVQGPYGDEAAPAIPTNFANTTTNEAITMEDLFILWQNSTVEVFGQNSSSFSLNDQSLLAATDATQLPWLGN